jgi:hypothetical protein
MHPPISAEQWTALRALREGAPPVFPLLATAACLHPSTIRERAAREGWNKLDLPRARAIQVALKAPPVTPVEADEQVAAMRAAVEGLGEGPGEDGHRAFLLKQLDEVRAGAIATGVLDKGRIDGLLSMFRLTEKLKTPAEERAEEDSDEDLRERLQRIDDRIVELAEAHANWLVGELHRGRLG